jgi:hypothetical protein
VVLEVDMALGTSIFLIAVGAVLAFAVNVHTTGIDLNTVGYILFGIGIFGLLLSMFFWSSWGGWGPWRRQTTTTYEDSDRYQTTPR